MTEQEYEYPDDGVTGGVQHVVQPVLDEADVVIPGEEPEDLEPGELKFECVRCGERENFDTECPAEGM